MKRLPYMTLQFITKLNKQLIYIACCKSLKIMEWTNELIEEKQTTEKVSALLLALEIIANGNPISVGLDEISDIAQKALDVFDEDE